MKKILSVLGTGFVILIGILVLLIVSIGYIFFLPFDIIHYHRMPYYKDLKKKYEFFITSKDIVKVYNRIANEQLPIEYVNNNEFEYFVKDGQVLLCQWNHEDFEQLDNQWFFNLPDDSGDVTTIPIEKALSEEREYLKPEHKNSPAKFLVFYNDITDTEKFEQAKECPYFHCVFSVDEDI